MSALPQAVSDALWDAQSTSPCEEERRAFDALRSAIESALSAAEARATRAEGALRGLNAAVENLIDAQGFDHEDGCPEDDTCDCPVAVQLNAAGSTAREVITDANDRARALAGEAQKEGTNG
jgi:hypothetical protein